MLEEALPSCHTSSVQDAANAAFVPAIDVEAKLIQNTTLFVGRIVLPPTRVKAVAEDGSYQLTDIRVVLRYSTCNETLSVFLIPAERADLWIGRHERSSSC
jgi:hypothetical protein